MGEVKHAVAVRRIGRISRITNAAVNEAVTKEVAKKSAEATLKSISKLRRELEQRQQVLAALEKDLEGFMQQAEMFGVTDGELIAQREETYSKQTRTVDPQVLLKKHGKKVYDAVIEVSITKLKTQLADKEIDAIAETTPAVKTGMKLKIKELNKETKKRGA